MGAEYQKDDLLSGAWMDDSHWVDVAKYVGSTTGTSRDNEVCSMYAPITWQVDRTCHMLSAASMDNLCKMMKDIPDDMSNDMHPRLCSGWVSIARGSTSLDSREAVLLRVLLKTGVLTARKLSVLCWETNVGSATCALRRRAHLSVTDFMVESFVKKKK